MEENVRILSVSAAMAVLPAVRRIAEDMAAYSEISADEALHRLNATLYPNPYKPVLEVYKTLIRVGKDLARLDRQAREARRQSRHYFLTHGKHSRRGIRGKRKA